MQSEEMKSSSASWSNDYGPPPANGVLGKAPASTSSISSHYAAPYAPNPPPYPNQSTYSHFPPYLATPTTHYQAQPPPPAGYNESSASSRASAYSQYYAPSGQHHQPYGYYGSQPQPYYHPPPPSSSYYPAHPSREYLPPVSNYPGSSYPMPPPHHQEQTSSQTLPCASSQPPPPAPVSQTSILKQHLQQKILNSKSSPVQEQNSAQADKKARKKKKTSSLPQTCDGENLAKQENLSQQSCSSPNHSDGSLATSKRGRGRPRKSVEGSNGDDKTKTKTTPVKAGEAKPKQVHWHESTLAESSKTSSTSGKETKETEMVEQMKNVPSDAGPIEAAKKKKKAKKRKSKPSSVNNKEKKKVSQNKEEKGNFLFDRKLPYPRANIGPVIRIIAKPVEKKKKKNLDDYEIYNDKDREYLSRMYKYDYSVYNKTGPDDKPYGPGQSSCKREAKNRECSDETNMSEWVCSLCQLGPFVKRLGELYGPYFVKCAPQQASSPAEKEVWFHDVCILWSPCYSVGVQLYQLESTIVESRESRCLACGKIGATLACFHRGCGFRSLHYPCAQQLGFVFNEQDFRAYCAEHNPSLSSSFLL